MSNLKNVDIQSIDHLGIIAGIIDSIGLVEIINEIVGQAPDEKVSAGHVVKAMILNGMGFVSSPLYMFPDFFQDKACEYLIGEGVKPEYLNDDKLGRVMDKLFIKGLTEVFFAISISVMKQFNISLKSSHLDSTSMHLLRHSKAVREVLDFLKMLYFLQIVFFSNLQKELKRCL